MRFIAFILSLSFAYMAFAQRGQEDFWRRVQHHREDLDKKDPGLLSPLQDGDKTAEKGPDTNTENEHGHGHEQGDSSSQLAGQLGGGIAGLLGFLGFLARLYQRFRQIRRAGEGYGEFFLDLVIALLSFFHRGRAPAIADV